MSLDPETLKRQKVHRLAVGSLHRIEPYKWAWTIITDSEIKRLLMSPYFEAIHSEAILSLEKLKILKGDNVSGLVMDDVYNIKLKMLPHPKYKVKVKFILKLVSDNGSAYVFCSSELLPYVWDSALTFSWRAQDFISISVGRIQLICQLFYDETRRLQYDPVLNRSRLNEFDSYERILDSDKLSDVTIVVGDVTFRAHKIILSARSDVFAAMFEHSMRENQENRVVIEDIDSEIMKEVLRFIYAGKVKNIKEFAIKLLPPAAKYNLHGLISICENEIIHSVSNNNVQEILSLADLFQSDALKKGALDFLLNNRTVLEGSDFKNFMKQLSSELLTEIVSLMSTTVS